jgi:D-sedoheptulose 7-phosphate isomerase
MRQQMTDYLRTTGDALRGLDLHGLEACADALFLAFLHRRQVFTMGNGASAALASHMACDLGKGTATDLGLGAARSDARRLRITSLVDNVPLLTAYGNDLSYHDVFVEQLRNVLEPGDVVVGISGSGGSPNVLRAMEFARAHDAITIGLTGQQPSAVKLRALSNICIQAPLTMMEQIEDVHVICHHMVALALRKRIAAYHLVAGPNAHPYPQPLLERAVLVANDN